MTEETLTKEQKLALNKRLYNLTFDALHNFWLDNVRYTRCTYNNEGTEFSVDKPSTSHLKDHPYWIQLHSIEKALLKEWEELSGNEFYQADGCIGCEHLKKVFDGACNRNKVDDEACQQAVNNRTCKHLKEVCAEF